MCVCVWTCEGEEMKDEDYDVVWRREHKIKAGIKCFLLNEKLNNLLNVIWWSNEEYDEEWWCGWVLMRVTIIFLLM